MYTITFEVPRIPESPKLRAIVEQSARNLISLFADHEDGINRAMVEGEGDKTTLSHSINLDLGKNKQTDKLSFSIKGGDEIVQSIPNPDQPDLFGKEPPLSGMRRTEGTVVDAEVVPLGLPAPKLELPGPTRTDDEELVYQEGRAAFFDGEALEENPYRSDVNHVQKLNKAWADGWRDAEEKRESWVEEGREAYSNDATPLDNPYDQDEQPNAYQAWMEGWDAGDAENANEPPGALDLDEDLTDHGSDQEEE